MTDVALGMRRNQTQRLNLPAIVTASFVFQRPVTVKKFRYAGSLLTSLDWSQPVAVATIPVRS